MNATGLKWTAALAASVGVAACIFGCASDRPVRVVDRRPGPIDRIGAMLDAWHAAAASADEQTYFSFFSGDDAVFMGTDATERWTVPEFKAYAHPFFERGRAWSFTGTDRHIVLGPSGDVAWFDEVVVTAERGDWRGSGVVVKIDGRWKIAHYNLSLPIPNEVFDDVLTLIRAHETDEQPADDDG